MIISSAGKDDIWWLSNISNTFNVILKGNSELTITTNATKVGWGAVLIGSSSGSLYQKKQNYILKF